MVPILEQILFYSVIVIDLYQFFLCSAKYLRNEHITNIMHYFSIENAIISNKYGFKPGNTKMECFVDLIEEILIYIS